MYNPQAQFLLEGMLQRLVDDWRKLDGGFLLRLAANFPILYQQFQVLYTGVDKLEEVLTILVGKMIQAHENRKGSLRKLDRKREQYPDWFLSEQLVGMMFYTERFCRDLPGFEEKLNYLEELGVNVFHFMPLLKCPPEKNDGGYAVSDFRNVNPALGSMDDIWQIAKQLHKKGMYLMLDLAINHTSDEHEWALKAKEGNQKYQEYFYIYPDRTIPDAFEQALPEVFPSTDPGNFTYVEELDKWVMTVFHQYQWDLNYTNPWVFLEMAENLFFLANKGVDIIRLDALAFTWKKIGTTSQNLDEAHLLMQAFKTCSRIVAPGMVFLAEAIVAPEEIIRYFGESQVVSNECDLAYNATLMTLLWESMATKNNRLLLMGLEQIPDRPPGTSWLNYIRCHDDIGLGYEDAHAGWVGYDPGMHRRFITDFFTGSVEWSFANGEAFMRDARTGTARISGTLASLAGLEQALEFGDEVAIEYALRRIELLFTVILTFGGIPMLYMGDEIGLRNDYSYLDDPSRRKDNRWMHRPDMDWKAAERRLQAGTLENRLFQYIKKVIQLRKMTPELADVKNTRLIRTPNTHLFVYAREREADKSLFVFNLNDQPEALTMETLLQEGFAPEQLSDSITCQQPHFERYQMILQPYQLQWFSS